MRKPKIPKPKPCPQCKGAESLEFQEKDWEGDPSEPGGRLVRKIDEHWACAECDYTEAHDPGADIEPDDYPKWGDKEPKP